MTKNIRWRTPDSLLVEVPNIKWDDIGGLDAKLLLGHLA